MANQADGLVAAVFGPRGFVAAVFGHARPQNLVGNFGVGNIGVAGAVAEAEQVACGGIGFGFGQKAVNAPARHGKCAGVLDDVAQGVLASFGRKGAKLDADVAVAPGSLQFVVGEIAHFLQMFGFLRCQSEALVEQAAAHGHGNGKPVGRYGFAQNTAAGGRQAAVAVFQFAALRQKFNALGQYAEIVAQLRAVARGQIESAGNAEALVRLDNAGLVCAVARITFAAVPFAAGTAIGRCRLLWVGRAGFTARRQRTNGNGRTR